MADKLTDICDTCAIASGHGSHASVQRSEWKGEPRRSGPPKRRTGRRASLAEEANVERQTLRQWIKRGLLPPAKIVSDGNGVKSRWPRVALEQARFIKEMRSSR